MRDTRTSHFEPKKIDRAGSRGQVRSKYHPEMPQNGRRGPRGHRIKQNKCGRCHWNVTALAPLGSLPTPLHPSTGITNLICNAHIWALHVNITTWTYCSNWYFSHFILKIRIHFERNYFWKHYSAQCTLQVPNLMECRVGSIWTNDLFHRVCYIYLSPKQSAYLHFMLHWLLSNVYIHTKALHQYPKQ